MHGGIGTSFGGCLLHETYKIGLFPQINMTACLEPQGFERRLHAIDQRAKCKTI
jgi:hypothetical protein